MDAKKPRRREIDGEIHTLFVRQHLGGPDSYRQGALDALMWIIGETGLQPSGRVQSRVAANDEVKL